MVPNFQDSVEKCGVLETRRYRICGVVQGVGFRPCVHKLARIFNVTGWILNDSEGVLVELQASSANITRLLDELLLSPPQWLELLALMKSSGIILGNIMRILAFVKAASLRVWTQ